MEETTLDMSEWYTATQAAERLTRNSGKQIDVSYPRKLAQYQKIRTRKISERMSLYYKPDVDIYVVEDRGEKVARAKRVAAKPKKSNKKAA